MRNPNTLPEHQPSPTDRRPIASPKLAVFQHLAAAALARAGVSANAVSIIGMLAGIAACVLLWATTQEFMTHRFAFLLSAVVILARLLANMLIGMVAVEGNARSPVGEL